MKLKAPWLIALIPSLSDKWKLVPMWTFERHTIMCQRCSWSGCQRMGWKIINWARSWRVALLLMWEGRPFEVITKCWNSVLTLFIILFIFVKEKKMCFKKHLSWFFSIDEAPNDYLKHDLKRYCVFVWNTIWLTTYHILAILLLIGWYIAVLDINKFIHNYNHIIICNFYKSFLNVLWLQVASTWNKPVWFLSCSSQLFTIVTNIAWSLWVKPTTCSSSYEDLFPRIGS